MAYFTMELEFVRQCRESSRPRSRGWLTRAAIRADKPGTSPCSWSSSQLAS